MTKLTSIVPTIHTPLLGNPSQRTIGSRLEAEISRLAHTVFDAMRATGAAVKQILQQVLPILGRGLTCIKNGCITLKQDIMSFVMRGYAHAGVIGALLHICMLFMFGLAILPIYIVEKMLAHSRSQQMPPAPNPLPGAAG